MFGFCGWWAPRGSARRARRSARLRRQALPRVRSARSCARAIHYFTVSESCRGTRAVSRGGHRPLRVIIKPVESGRCRAFGGIST